MTFTDLLKRQRVAYRLADGGQEVAICCLFCHFNGEEQDHRFRLYLNTVSGAGFCFNCGWRTRYGIPQVLRRLKVPEATFQFEEPSKAVHSEPVLPPDFQALWKPVDRLDREALRYVRQRGIPDRQIKEKGLGVSYVGDFAYRVLFPIMDGEVLKGLTGRAFTGEPKIKYRHMRGDKHLYNLGDQRRVVISEGVFKALRIEQVVSSQYGSLACLGHSLSEAQLGQLEAHRVCKVVLWPDPDPAGVRGFLGVAEKLQHASANMRAGGRWNLTIEMVWPVTVAADNATTAQLRESWRNHRQPLTWMLMHLLSKK